MLWLVTPAYWIWIKLSLIYWGNTCRSCLTISIYQSSKRFPYTCTSLSGLLYTWTSLFRLLNACTTLLCSRRVATSGQCAPQRPLTEIRILLVKIILFYFTKIYTKYSDVLPMGYVFPIIIKLNGMKNTLRP